MYPALFPFTWIGRRIGVRHDEDFDHFQIGEMSSEKSREKKTTTNPVDDQIRKIAGERTEDEVGGEGRDLNEIRNQYHLPQSLKESQKPQVMP